MSQMPGEVTGRSYITGPALEAHEREVQWVSLPAGAFVEGRTEVSMHIDLRWYVACTRSRHEKAVAEQLQGKGIETFIPLYKTLRRWKNGDHWVHLPLFPGYAFVRFDLSDRLPVLKVPGVVRLMGFNGTPAVLEDDEVESLRRALAAGVNAEPHPYLRAGQRVRITAGPLVGREGTLMRRKGMVRVVLSIDLIQRSVLVDVNADVLEPA